MRKEVDQSNPDVTGCEECILVINSCKLPAALYKPPPTNLLAHSCSQG